MKSSIASFERRLDAKRRLMLPSSLLQALGGRHEERRGDEPLAMVTATDTRNGLPYIALLPHSHELAQGFFMLMKPARIDRQRRLILPRPFHDYLGQPGSVLLMACGGAIRLYANSFSEAQCRLMRRSVDRLLSAGGAGELPGRYPYSASR